MPCALGPHDPEPFFNIHLRPREVSLPRLGQRPQGRSRGALHRDATDPLIEWFTALAPVPPAPISPSVDSDILLNLRGGYRFWHDKAEVAIAVYNALNDRHKEHPLGDARGSRVMGWVTLRF